MEDNYIEDKRFEQIDFTEKALPAADYEHCNFINCNLSNTDLSKINFTACEFDDCNISMAALHKTAFRDCKFRGCKLLGLHFEDCNEFGFDAAFDNCIINLSSFYKMKLKKAVFNNSTLHEVDFTEADLSNSVFDNCDLLKAIFDNTILEKADLSTAYNFSVDPERNRVKKAKFSMANIVGLLDKYDIEVM